MENYKGFLIEQYPRQVEVPSLVGNQKAYTMEWSARIINPQTAKVKSVGSVEQAKAMIDSWASYGNALELDNLKKQIIEKEVEVKELEEETKAKIEVLIEKLRESKAALGLLKLSIPDDEFFRS